MLPTPPDGPLVIGHRGAPGYRPEHTRSSYGLAIAMGADAVEPDVVFSRDGVLVVRHENEIGATTDVAERPEFAARRTTKVIDGTPLTGWFTEDFTWEELATLRCRERLPALRPDNTAFNDTEPILRLRDLLDLVRAAGAAAGREVGVVLEIKHATYFDGLGFDTARVVVDELRAAGWAASGHRHPLVIESFESTVLDRLRELGVAVPLVYLFEASGRPADLVAARGDDAPTYRAEVSARGLDRLVGRFDGISVDKRMLLAPDAFGRPTPRSRIVPRAHERGLTVYTWTCRPENAFLLRAFRRGGEPGAFGDHRAEWAVLRDAGVDGVFVDHADLGIEAFRPVAG